MTGLSVLFNLKTEEACYIYGNMDSYRRLNEQSIQERYSGGLTERSRTYRDLRYAPSSELSSFTPHYTEPPPRYRSQYALHSDNIRDPYQSYSGINTNLYSDGGNLSTYSRSYAVRNRNLDVASTHFDTSRLFDRKSPETDRGILELGTDFRRRIPSDKTHDVAGSSYRRDSGGDVPTKSPARTKSLRDHDKPKEEYGDTLLQPVQRQRINSGDSVSSQTSERSDKGDNSKALFKARQNRYKENAEKHAEESTKRTPFSSWRRSANFEDDEKIIGSKSVDSEKSKIERQSKIFTSADDHSSHDYDKKDLRHEGIKFERPQLAKDAVSPKQQETDKADELMFNFRQALRRHQISEEKRTSEERDSSKDENSTAGMIEKIRAAKAQIKQLKESQTKPKDSKDAPTIFSEREKLPSSSVEESKVEKNITKAVPKLARQKLVSDDLKAKYIESKREEKENEDILRPRERENEDRKQSYRKHKEHKEYRSEPEAENIKAKEDEKSNIALSDREHFRKAIADRFKKESSGFEFGTSFTGKPKSDESKDKQTKKVTEKLVEETIQTEEIAHEVQSPPSKVKTSSESKDFEYSSKPVYSLVYQEPTSKSKSSFSQPYGYTPKPSSDQFLSHESSQDKAVKDSEKSKEESRLKGGERKPRRQPKKHTKAKSVELGLLSHPKEDKADIHESQDDTSVIPVLTADELSRKERIDKYKEERKRQLATIFTGGHSELPSLFLSGRTETETAPLSRSRSLKVESDAKPDSSVSEVGRSKSMKESSPAQVSKISGLQLAELGSQSKGAYERQHGTETSKQTVKLTGDSRDKNGIDKHSKEITHRTMLADMVLAEDREQAFKMSLEKETDSGHESTDSTKRIRRQLPSLEDVLGTNIAESSSHERKHDVKAHYTDLKKPKQNDKNKAPVEFSLDYSKVKITPKSIPVEMSQGQVIFRKYEDLNIDKTKDEVFADYSGSETSFQIAKSGKRADMDLKEKTTEIPESEVPKDSVSKVSKYFIHSEKQGRPDSMIFASDYRKPKMDDDRKPIHELKVLADKDITVEEHKKDSFVNQTEIPSTERYYDNEEVDKSSDRSSTPERVIKVSDARKLFSESSGQQIFGTDYVHRSKEPEKIGHTKQVPSGIQKEPDTETEWMRQSLHGVRSSSTDISETIHPDIYVSHSQQKTVQHQEIPASDQKVDVSAAKPPLSPRTERKRSAETKFGKVSYRSNGGEDGKYDVIKDREMNKPSKEKGYHKDIRHVTEQSSSVESLPKTDVRAERTAKERSPSVESVPKTGVTKISYRDLERGKHERSSKFETDSHAKTQNMVFGSDYRKPKPDSLDFISDHAKWKPDSLDKGCSENILLGSEYVQQKPDTEHNDYHHNIVTGGDFRKPKTGSDTTERPQAVLFGTEFRKPKADIKADVVISGKDTKTHDLQVDQRETEWLGLSLQPSVGERAITKKDANIEKPVLNVQARSVSKEEKYPFSKTTDAKLDIKAEAVSAASGQIIEVPVSPRQKSPPKIVNLVGQDRVSKTEIIPTVKPVITAKTKIDTREEVHETTTQISVEKHISEPSISVPYESTKFLPTTSDRLVMTSKTVDNDKAKPVQYVHPSPLLTFSAKTEAPSKMDTSEIKTVSQVEKKTEAVKPVTKELVEDNVRESDRAFISKRAKEEEWKKPVDTSSEFHQKAAEKMLLDTSLDDILSRNVDYLSDTGESPATTLGRGHAEKKARPQSVHEESRSHGRTKRIFKKKNLQRSKSEDRSHFKVEESGAVRRSKGTEDIDKPQKKTASGISKSGDKRFLQRDRTSTESDSTSSERVSRLDFRQKPKSEGSVEKVLAKSSVIQDKVRKAPNETRLQTAVPVSDKDVIAKAEYVENQAGAISGAGQSEALREHGGVEKDFSDTASDHVTHSSMELLSASDTSDLPEKKRYEILSGDGKRGNEVSRRVATPDSELSGASSSLSDGTRKKRKDKSSLRKSKLNESSDDSVSRRKDDSSRLTNRIGVRRVSSSRLARESREDKYKEEADRRLHDAEKLTNQESSLNQRNGNVNQSNNLSSAQNKSLNNLDQITSHSRVIHSTVLDSQTVLPSRFALPSKVSSAISKLSETKEGSPSTKDERTSSPRSFRRGNNFSELLQKFSSSDASSSEKSDTDSKSANLRKPFLTRQEAYTVSSSTSSEEARRTPERTQSLRLRTTHSPAVEKEAASVQRSSSFKSDFMRRRFSPEPEQRRKLPETPVAQKHVSEQTVTPKHLVEQQVTPKHIPEKHITHKHMPEQSDKPSPELADVLSRRSEIVKKQQETGKVQERERIHDGKIEKADKFSSADVDQIIVDSEVAKMLRSRRKETDTAVESRADKDTRSQIHPEPKVETTPYVKDVTKLSDRSRSHTPEKSIIKTEIPQVKSIVKPKVEEHPVSLKQKTDINAVSKLDLSSIDKSLAVLEHVTHELDEPEVNLKDEKELKLHKALKDVHVDKQAEVAQFITSVESDQLNASHSVLQPKVRDTKLNGDIVKLKKERTQDTSNNALKDNEPEMIKDRHEEDIRAESPSAPGTVDITNKSEIKRKFTRDRTPERQSPKRTGPMKVTSLAKVSGSAGLQRTESVGRSDSERPKGILKRTPSLHKAGVNVDPELASILKNRRAKQDDVEEEVVTEKLSAQEEIRKSRESQQSIEDDREERNVSVAERIFQMHNKIEEVRSCPITPKYRSSGLTTPKSLLDRSGDISPKSQFSFDDTEKASPVSGSQLLERLTSLEDQQGAVRDRRKRFQQGRRQHDWRTRTQPVTLLEIQEADSLETVRKFRSEILHKASSNIFENLQKEEKFPGKKTEYPQPFRKDRRPRDQRHKTLPVTAAELNAVPEDHIAEPMNALKKKFEAFGARDSKADSGILSGSEVDFQDKESEKSLDENIAEDDPVKLSVSAKASMFLQMEEKSKERPDKKSASGAKRYIDRKKRERSRTQPITEDEVHTAAVKADEENAEEKAKTTNVSSERDEIPDEGQGDADELSRQSLADKVRLFKSIEEAEKQAPKKAPAPPPKRRNRKLASRFATQPVTYEEVEKAAKISPLAMSLVKPPDPEILSGLSVKAQRELMAQHAQKCLSQPGSRAGSQPVSRTTSVGDLSVEPESKGSDTTVDTAPKGILKDNILKSDDTDVKGILKMDTEKTELISDRKGILKSQQLPGETDQEVRSILKLDDKSQATDDSEKPSRSVLKQELEEKLTLHLQKESKVKGILKTEGENVETTSEIKSVLKKEYSSETSNKPPEPKSILKKEGSFEQRSAEPEKVVPEKPKVEDIAEQGGVSDDSLDNLDSDDGILSHSPTPESDKTSDSKDAPVRRSSKSRRRFNRDRKLEAERYHTQPAEVKQDEDDGSDSPTRRKKMYTGRHMTQPITPDEKREAQVATAMPEIQKTGSITDRLNALKKSGDEEWRKRVSKPVDLEGLTPTKTPPQVKMREKEKIDMPRPSSIADRLTLLDSAQEGWRDRVGQTDVKKFTIEHKLSSSGQSQGESPLVARLRQKPRRDASRESDTSETSDLPSPLTPTKESSKIPLPKEIICTDIPDDFEDSQNRPVTLATIKSIDEDEKKGPVSVEVPKIDEEFEEFFQTKRESILSDTTISFDVDDFNELFLSANDILHSTKKIRPKRRHTASSRNPLKTMSACLEVRSEYTEIITGVAEQEMKRIQTAKIAQGSSFAAEALAGLASKENFSKIELRKTESNGIASKAGNTRHDPYLPLMLIHIKGRRKVQCRLVEPSASSLNSGDCFIAVTPDKIVQFLGEFCNVIEKAKAADVADFVKQKRDLGCKAHSITTVEEKKALMGAGKQFFSLIGGLKDYMNCGPQEEDELYENHIVETNMIYRLEKNKLVPVEEYWGNQPKYEMLKPDQVFVFDFGSELYIWQGRSVTPAQRKVGLKLAEQLWEKGFDYSACDVNPLCPMKTEEEGGLPMKSDTRPEWALFGKVNQNMETILFREKFADWPDTSRLIKAKSQEEVSTTKFDIADLKPYDAKLMVPVNSTPVSLKLEGSHVGRGTKWEEDMEGFKREQNIETLKVVVWHVLEYDHFQVEEHSYGQFHEGDTYVIRWQYMIVNAGMRNLKGEASRHTQLGRERCAYFFWQGKSSTINEKGASALMTVELDEERGPQVLVEEGKEPACFLNLFKGHMIIHIGKREDELTNTQGNWRFYCLRNEYENEMCLIEVPAEMSSLRSVSSFLFLNVKNGALTVWHGCKSPDHTRKLALKAAENLKERCPLEVGLHKNASISVTEVEEGGEKTEFWRMMNVHIRDRSLYCSLLSNPESFIHTLRLFHMTSVSGVFEVHEIVNPSRSPDLPTKFPVLQTDLYKASQPALFLVDNGHEMYLWQGWWPEGDENQENVLTGSAQTRFTADRRCAMETTLHYCKEINADNPPSAFVVYAGLEPLQFTNLFPFWTVDERVREINLKEGKQDGDLVSVEELLKKVTKTRFTLAELMEPTLPEGVDPLKLESYLSDEEFQEVFSMNKEDFYALPGWKQQKVKQEAGLF